jgi:hypothetical protein
MLAKITIYLKIVCYIKTKPQSHPGPSGVDGGGEMWDAIGAGRDWIKDFRVFEGSVDQFAICWENN